ncbi:MAG: lipid A biosynthesis acyltransferase [Cyclobacteriaceae bacterium]|nr:lipid A biosynthesis acyltransferase [Cyclobacteriaceae bacterium]
MPEWQGKSRGNKLGYRIFVAVCKTVGIKPAYLLLRAVALYFFLFSRETSKHIYQYFTKRHGYGKVKAIQKLYTNYYKFGQTLLDKIVVMSGIENKFTYHFDGEENLVEIVSRNRGGVLLSAHVGNWEVAGHFLNRLNITIHVVMFDGEHQQIKNYLDEVTGGRKFNVIVIRDDMSHIYAISEALQKNELVCMHADRFIDRSKTTLYPLLGEPALFPAGPFMLASSFNVPVSIVFAFKETDRHYHFFGSKPISKHESESKREFADRLGKIFAGEMETKLRLYPEQWFNYYNFWAK